jgi:hypothetical protein
MFISIKKGKGASFVCPDHVHRSVPVVPWSEEGRKIYSTHQNFLQIELKIGWPLAVLGFGRVDLLVRSTGSVSVLS